MNRPDQALKRIFTVALALPAGPERTRFLDQACLDDSPLRNQVDLLLTAHAEAGRFLGSAAVALDPGRVVGPGARRHPPTDTSVTLERGPEAGSIAFAPPPAIVEGPGTLIGPYKLLQRIGEGGMGVVFMAEQERPIRRKVALKVIKPGMDSAQVIARFEAERQALALMDHPHIARVLDVGATAAGRPFFVMELVKGVPITEYCDRNHLTPRERLELFVPVCRAIQHAHQKGIIHRDIKPSNVMVTLHDGVPEPRVIDFGVAKAVEQRLTDRTMFTEFGALIGTLEYMSPEQAELGALDVDTRSDIYSLGVLLYELLTGSTPLDRTRLRQAAYSEILRRVREEEPPRPSTRLSDSREALPTISAQRRMDTARLSKLVRGDLDWIVMKALEKDRTRRYETAIGFARDIRRHLDGDTVEATPPSTIYRLGKFARRHRAGLATATAFGGLLVAATLVSVGLALRAIQAEATAMTQLDLIATAEQRAVDQKQRAQARERMAVAVVRRFSEVVRDNPELKHDPKLAPLRQKLLKEPQAYFGRLSAELEASRPPTPDVLASLAEALIDLGRIDDEIGDQGDALRAFEQAVPLLESLAAANPEPSAVHADLAMCWHRIGRSLFYAGRYPEATAAVARAAAIQGRLVAARPDDLGLRADLATSQTFLADRAAETHRPDQPTAADLQARAIREQLVRDFPTSDRAWNELADSLVPIGAEHFAAGRVADGDAAFRRSRAIRERLVREHPEVADFGSDLAFTCHNYGFGLEKLGRLSESLALYRRALEVHERLAQAYPANNDIRADLSWSHYLIGSVLTLLGRRVEASDALGRALVLRQEAVSKNPTNVSSARGHAYILVGIGELHRLDGRADLARAAYAAARAIHERLDPDAPADWCHAPGIARVDGCLGLLEAGQGRRAEALVAFKRARAALQRLARAAPDNVEHEAELYWLDHLVGEWLQAAGPPAEALACLEDARARRERLDRLDPATATFRRGLATPIGEVGMIQRLYQAPAAMLVLDHGEPKRHAGPPGELPAVSLGDASALWLHRSLAAGYAAAGRPADADRSAAVARDLQARLGNPDPTFAAGATATDSSPLASEPGGAAASPEIPAGSPAGLTASGRPL